MPEQTFRSPNFYEREIDLSAPQQRGPTGTPAGVIGTSNKGPAFVPVTVASFDEFVNTFGNLDPKFFGPYAVNEFLKHRSALTYLRVLGAGANKTDADIAKTLTTGQVKNAGFFLTDNVVNVSGDNRHMGAAQMLVGKHSFSVNEAFGMPMFTDNNSFNGVNANLVRALILPALGARVMVFDGNQNITPSLFLSATSDDIAQTSSNQFKLVVSSSLGTTFANSDGCPGVKIFTASLDPSSTNYYGKLLNSDPDSFVSAQHLLYVDYAVDNEIATVDYVGITSGTVNLVPGTSTTFRAGYGSYDTRFRAPKTTMFISQPFGTTEYDLFYFEALDDGAYANNLYKISIANLAASVNDANQYGTFTVQIRDWDDTDQNPIVLESFYNCSLDPNADNYVAKVIGDRKVYFNFDSVYDSERRLVSTGKYPNVSKYVRIRVTDEVERSLVPAKSLPFGFRGLEILKTSVNTTDYANLDTTNNRLGCVNAVGTLAASLTGSLVPPVPFRFKLTRGDVATFGFDGNPGYTEVVNPSLYWGIKFERNTSPLNPNLSNEKNKLLESLTKFVGLGGLDLVATGSYADTINNNKFSLSRVAFGNTSINDLTSSIQDHILSTAYLRNAQVDPSDYTINSNIGKRITLATILAKDTPANFNKWSQYAKFTNMLFGGFDGLNILSSTARRMNDKSTSFDSGGGASTGYIPPGLLLNVNGAGQSNSNVFSYTTAIDIMTDPLTVNTNILCIPGIRESYLTDYAMKKVRNYGLAYYVMDIPSYDSSLNRLYDDSTARPDVSKTIAQLNTRAIDNNYVGTYYPNVFIDDAVNRRRLKVPASVAAMGALAFNDRVAYPWFAPAGFNRAALDFVTNVDVRLSVSDRDQLYESRINPIATFPRLGYVIYGQKTLQIAKSSLDRVNVRRLLLEVKRTVIGIANQIVFEQNTPTVRNKFVADVALQLGLIQSQAGIEAFQVICNETNNTQEDIDLNRLNGRIVIVPTRVVEFIAIDFIITNSGVQFM